ncbi:MAG TPA: zf-HC2 domain-containing protein [Acidisarcina sp.]
MAKLDDCLDQKLDAELRAEVDSHLRGCEHCLITMNTTRMTIEIYRRNDIYELPETLRTRLEASIMARCKKC